MKKLNDEEGSYENSLSLQKLEEIQCAKMLSDNWSPLKKQKVSLSQHEESLDANLNLEGSLLISLNLQNKYGKDSLEVANN